MAPRYIIRLDDASEQMNTEKWMKICNILLDKKITPIIAAIPFNEDKQQQILSEGWKDFWQWLKDRQDKDGWYIAIHGNTHVYTNKRKGLLRIGKKSEFSGLSYEKQKRKISSSLARFHEKGLNNSMFVAPSHSFDVTTLRVLKELGVNYVSDGHGHRPFKFKEINFIPQQLWQGKIKRAGVWTICLHPNTMLDEDIAKLNAFIKHEYSFMLRREINLYNLKYENYGLHQIMNQLSFILYEKCVTFIKYTGAYNAIRKLIK